MGEGFGADVADACYIGVGGEDKGVREVHVNGLGVDTINDGLDCVFWRLLAEKSEDFFAFLAEWDGWLCVRYVWNSGENRLTLIAVFEIRCILFLLLADQLLVW